MIPIDTVDFVAITFTMNQKIIFPPGSEAQVELAAIVIRRITGEGFTTGCSANSSAKQDGSSMSVADWSFLGSNLRDRMVDGLKRSTSLISVITLAKEDKYVGNLAHNPAFKNLALDYARSGVERILAVDLSQYVEWNLPDLLRFHVEKQACHTQVMCRREEQGVALLDADYLVRSHDSSFLDTGAPGSYPSQYECSGYFQRFVTPGDYRELVRAALQGRAKISPDGVESMPGIWIACGAKLAPSARLLAPCYIGANTNVAHGALITRNTSIERQSFIDCGTLVSDSTVLPGTHVGPGLHVSQSIVAGTRLLHLGRNTGIELGSTGLLRHTNPRLNRKLTSEVNLLGA